MSSQYIFTMYKLSRVHPPDKRVLEDISLSFLPGAKIGVLGANGAGKSTLLRIMAGQDTEYRGDAQLAPGASVGLLEQEPQLDAAKDVRGNVEDGVRDLRDMLDRFNDLAMGYSDETADEFARLQDRIDAADAWQLDTTLEIAMDALRLPPGDADVSTLSGGERRRVALCRLLLQAPDLLLLDEPTNHLDISSLEWLEGYLTGLDAAVILVAHDRWFLEAVGTSVLELEAGRARFFPGPWHAWRRELAAREIALGKAIEKQQREIERMERFVERFRYKASKARQAQERVKRLEKMDRIERDPADTRSLGFSFGAAERTGRVVLELDDGRLEVPGRTLLQEGELWLERAEHVSLVGPNGVGKTTLIEAIAGRRDLDGGRLRTGHNVKHRLPHPARRRARHPGHRARGGAARHRPDAEQGARSPGSLPVLGRGGGEADGRALGRGAAPPLAGSARGLWRQRADPRRADQPPRPRCPRSARGRPSGLRGRGAARVARPRPSRRRRQPHGRLRGRHAPKLRRRLGRVRPRSRGAP
jgi:energy-dependent translational throttle protein EttA